VDSGPVSKKAAQQRNYIQPIWQAAMLVVCGEVKLIISELKPSVGAATKLSIPYFNAGCLGVNRIFYWGAIGK
jgi:hypothetical protein